MRVFPALFFREIATHLKYQPEEAPLGGACTCNKGNNPPDKQLKEIIVGVLSATKVYYFNQA